MPEKDEVTLGTTIMAVSFDGGVVLGADTRTSRGAYIMNRVSDKLTKLSEAIYCCRSGSAADTQAVSELVFAKMREQEYRYKIAPTVREAATWVRRLVYHNPSLLAGMIVAGCDSEEGAAVYSVPLGGSLIKQPYAVGGSGSQYIVGFCDAHFREGMGREEAVEFVRAAISLAISRDNSSGGCIRMLVITRDAQERVFVPGDTLKIHMQ